MRATGNAPVTAADGGSAPVVHVAIIDISPGADIGSAPALAGHCKALAPATGTLGSAESGSGCVDRAFAGANTTLTRQIERCGWGGRG